MKRILIATALLFLVGGGPSLANEFKENRGTRRPMLAAHSPHPSAKISLNTATSRELRKLPGIGELLAQRIIAARPFRQIEDLKTVKGIPPSHYAQVKDLVKL